MLGVSVNVITVIIGSLLIVMLGINMMGITKIKVADYLPAIIYAPIIYNILPAIKNLISIIF